MTDNTLRAGLAQLIETWRSNYGHAHSPWQMLACADEVAALLQTAPPAQEQKPFVTGESSDWWVCFHCWLAYHVPTTGYYGDCSECHKPTQKWPADPTQTLLLREKSS